MFKHEFQGGPYFEIFSAQGKDPTSLWKLQGGSGIRKVYDKDVKSYVYSLEGTAATTKMQIPKDPKLNLMLVQRFLVLQMFVAKGQDISLEIGVTDVGSSKRRLNFSSAVKELSVTPLLARIPFTLLQRAIWLNCCFDMVAIVGDLWRGQTYHSVESITVSANCRLRRIFTMKFPPYDNTDENEVYKLPQYEGEYDFIPRPCQISPDVPHKTQIINITKIRETEARARGERVNPIEIDLNSSGRKTISNDGYHIAFGTKVAAPPATASYRKGSLKDASNVTSARSTNGSELAASAVASSAASQDLSASGSKQALIQNGRRLRLYSEASEDGQDAYSTDITNANHLMVRGAPLQDVAIETKATVLPHPPPPRDSGAEKRTRRSVRVRSGGKHRSVAATDGVTQNVRSTHTSVSAPAHIRTRADAEADGDAEGRHSDGDTNAVADSNASAAAAARLAEHTATDFAKRDTVFVKLGAPRRRLAAVSPRDPGNSAGFMDSRAVPLAPIGSARHEHERRLPHTDRGSHLMFADPAKADDSIGDVIEVLHAKPSVRPNLTAGGSSPKAAASAYEDGQSSLMSGDVSTAEEREGEEEEELFQFSSPPKAAAALRPRALAHQADSGMPPRRKNVQLLNGAGMPGTAGRVRDSSAAATSATTSLPATHDIVGDGVAAAAAPSLYVSGRRHARPHQAVGKLDLAAVHLGTSDVVAFDQPPSPPAPAATPISGTHAATAKGSSVAAIGGRMVHQPVPPITPRPPDSPRTTAAGSCSRPGSGRLRSVNSSAKTSPSTSGTALALHDAILRACQQPVTSPSPPSGEKPGLGSTDNVQDNADGILEPGDGNAVARTKLPRSTGGAAAATATAATVDGPHVAPGEREHQMEGGAKYVPQASVAPGTSKSRPRYSVPVAAGAAAVAHSVPQLVPSATQPKVAASSRFLSGLRPSQGNAEDDGDSSHSLLKGSRQQRSSTPTSPLDDALQMPRSALSRVELNTRDSDRMSTSVSSQASARLTRKSLKEIPKDDVRLSKTRLSGAKDYDSQKYQLNKDDTFDEKDMLEWMKRDQEGHNGATAAMAAAVARLSPIDGAKNHRYETEVETDDAADDSDSLSDESLAHHKANRAPAAGDLHLSGAAPDHLNESNPREWSECSIFSPPIEPRPEDTAIDSLQPTDSLYTSKRGLSKPAQNGISSETRLVNAETDSEEELDLLYDPILNCYFDPVTCKYYELI